MVYAEYEYYKTIYHGSLPSEEFNRFSRQASAYLDQVTFGRIKEATEAVKDACCAVVDELYLRENPRAVSETVQSWSKTFSADNTPAQQRLYNAAALYLGMTGLLYRGM